MAKIAKIKSFLNSKLNRLISNSNILFKKAIILCIVMNWYKTSVKDHLAKCTNVTTIKEVI